MVIYEGDNIGGIASIEIAHQAYFSGFNPVAFVSGKGWIKIPFTPEKANLVPKEENTPNGIVFSYSGSFFVNNLRSEIFDNINVFIGKKSVIKITDLNDQVYIIGAPGYPCDLSFDGATGSSYTDANGATYKFGVDQPFRFFKA